MDNIFVYYRNDLPPKINEMVTPCADGYTVYIREGLDDPHRLKAYQHALKHIENGDFDIDCTKSVQEMEAFAHSAPERVVTIAKFRKEIEELKKQRRKIQAEIRKKQKQIEFLQGAGVDFMAVAESRWLEPM